MKASAKKEAPTKKDFAQILRVLRGKGSSKKDPVKEEPISGKSNKKSAVKESA
jgi:hypothetical protein